MFRLLITFIIFCGVIYYFDIDVRGLVDKSGVPEWIANATSKGESVVASVVSTTTDASTASSTATTTPS